MLQLIRVHELAGVEEIVEQAIRIANEAEVEGKEWSTVFTAACGLLGARMAYTPQPTPTLDLSGLRH